MIHNIPHNIVNGDVAQLGERGVRNAEVRGSIPLISTKRIE
jgi:hypothetical protein